MDLKMNEFIQEQLSNWDLAAKSYANLKTRQTKVFDFGDFEFKVQFNPARIISSAAKTDSKSIADRACFLCTENRPPAQKGIDADEFEVLINPFPIFPEHFSIVYKQHIEQQILPFFNHMLRLAKKLDKYVIFYNGPKCGASAPDHMHFQAGTKDFLPLINDYNRLKHTHAELLVKADNMKLYQLKNYLRTVYCIESFDIKSAIDAFEKLYKHLATISTSQSNITENEPMMNIICNYVSDKWFVFVLPRKTFRPWQYSANENEKLLISPATVELGGIFITPVESHFNKITKEDIVDILQQVSL